MSRLQHRSAKDLTPAWIGQNVTFTDVEGVATSGGLADYLVRDDAVIVWAGGTPATLAREATITQGTLEGLL